MKKSRIIAPAAAILVFSSAAAVTGTVAWFTANNLVSVSGMQVKAQAEQGILIANETHAADADWNTTVTASHSGENAAFVPVSTCTTYAWFHGFASSGSDGQAYESIDTINPVDNVTTPSNQGTAGDGIHGFLDNSVWKNAYLLNSFYIQSSSSVAAINNQDIYVKDFTVSAATQELSKALRIAIIYDDGSDQTTETPIIVAPVTGADLAYDVGLTGAKTSYTALAASAITDTSKELVSGITIPAYLAAGTNALKFNVYIYFEGEDAACKSTNIEEQFESLSVSFKFGNKEHD